MPVSSPVVVSLPGPFPVDRGLRDYTALVGRENV